jgi:hypothetical protein
VVIRGAPLIHEASGDFITKTSQGSDSNTDLAVLKTSIPRCRFLSKPVDTKALLSAIAELGGN